MVSVNLPESCESSETVTIDIPHDNVFKSFKMIKSSPRIPSLYRSGKNPMVFMDQVTDYGYWYGENNDDGSTFNYVQDGANNMAGSLVDIENDVVMQFKVENGNQTVIITNSSSFPPEYHHDINKRMLSIASDEKQSNEQPSQAKKAPSHSSNLRGGKRTTRSLYDDNGGNLDIVVVWTKRAECRNAGLDADCTLTQETQTAMQNLVNLSIEETNTAYELSGVETRLLLAHSYRHPTYDEKLFGLYKSLFELGEGRIEGVHESRATYGGDLVAMVLDDTLYCGAAYSGPTKDTMFSVVAWNCATGYFSFGHEVGHNLGLLHDRGSSNACDDDVNYNYGYRDPDARFRTILAYRCRTNQCDINAANKKCTRIQRFSNPNIQYNDSPVGSATEDNARKLNEVSAEVAAYFPHGGVNPTPSPTASPSRNIAVFKPTVQSSTSSGGESSRAVDGKTDGYWGNNGVTHTNAMTDPSWAVNLMSHYNIDRIVVYNRLDECCMDQLSGFVVVVWNDGKKVWTSTKSNETPKAINTIVVPSIVGDKVEVMIPGVQKVLSIAEVEVYGIFSSRKFSPKDTTLTVTPTEVPTTSLTNIALFKPTSQSSTLRNGVASRVVDGNTDGNYANGSVSHTKPMTNPSWSVNLMTKYIINTIKVYNRQDCCASRLDGFKVIIWNGDKQSFIYTHDDGTPDAVTNVSIPNKVGDRVEIMIPGIAKMLSLAEVEVYGRYIDPLSPTVQPTLTPTSNPTPSPSLVLTPSPTALEVQGKSENIARGKPTSQSSTYINGVSSRAVDGNKDAMWSGESITHTRHMSNPSWSVNLMGRYMINQIKVYNRQDCCKSRLSGFKVIIWNNEVPVWTFTHHEGTPKPVTVLDVPDIIGNVIEILIPGARKVLSLAEVEAFGPYIGKPATTNSPLNNIALKKPTSQSSTAYGGISSRAVDGNTNGYWSNSSVTHTHSESNPTWSVHLMSQYAINQVKVYNRRDCCSNRLTGFKIIIWNGLPGVQAWTYTQSENIPEAVTSIDIPNVRGDRVEIMVPRNSAVLSLAEVEVYGVEVEFSMGL